MPVARGVPQRGGLRLAEGVPLRTRGNALAYDRLAFAYDALAWLYSGGAISALKGELARQLRPGERALMVGVGTSNELAVALGTGACITALDRSRGMLGIAERRLGKDARAVHLVCEDFFDHTPETPYDTIVANFFLNVFAPRELNSVFRKLARLLEPSGRLLVGDFAPPQGAPVRRALQQLYHAPPLVLFRLLTNNGWHGVYDLAPHAAGAGFVQDALTTRPIFKLGPRLLAASSFTRRAL